MSERTDEAALREGLRGVHALQHAMTILAPFGYSIIVKPARKGCPGGVALNLLTSATRSRPVHGATLADALARAVQTRDDMPT